MKKGMAGSGTGIASRLKSSVIKYLLIIVIVAVALAFYAINDAFFTVSNLFSILRTASIVGILACACVVLMSTGEINFAISSQAILSGMVLGKIYFSGRAILYPVGVLAAIGVAVAISLLAAFFIIELSIPSFIVTLALNSAILGTMRIFCQTAIYIYSPNWGRIFTLFGQEYLFGVIPTPVLVFLIIALATHLFMEKTTLGRGIFSVGSNPTACVQVGGNVKKIKYLAFAISAVLTCLAGIIFASVNARLNTEQASSLLMPSICATLLGATFLIPGKYNVPGATVAAILVAVLDNGMLTVGAPAYLSDIIQGVILVTAVGIIASVREGGLPKVEFSST